LTNKRLKGVYAEGTTTVDGGKIKIISSGRMDDELRSLECPSDTELIVEISTKAGYDQAKKSWTWVTDADKSFIFIADGDCGGEDGLRAYEISEATFDDSTQKATLKGEIQEKHEWLTDAKLRISSDPFDGFKLNPQKRNSGDISIAKDFSGKEIFGMDVSADNKTRIGLTCADCALTGGIHYDVELGWGGFSGSITTTNGLGFRLGLGVQLAVQFTEQKDVKLDILPVTGIPGASFHVPLIGDVGFETAIAVVGSLSAVQADITAKFGVAMTIPDQTTWRIDDDSDEFEPKFEQIGPELSANVSVTASVSPVVTLGMGAHIMGQGVTAGFALQAPRLTANLNAEASTQGTCNNPNAVASIGLKLDLDAAISIFYGFGSPTDLPNQKQIYQIANKNLLDICYPIGGENPPPPPSTPKPFLNNACIGGRPESGDLRYTDGSMGRYCNKGSGEASVIGVNSAASMPMEIGVDANGSISKCTLHKTVNMKIIPFSIKCLDPIMEVPKGSL